MSLGRQDHGPDIGPVSVTVQQVRQRVRVGDAQGVDRRIIHDDSGHTVGNRLV